MTTSELKPNPASAPRAQDEQQAECDLHGHLADQEGRQEREAFQPLQVPDRDSREEDEAGADAEQELRRSRGELSRDNEDDDPCDQPLEPAEEGREGDARPPPKGVLG
jgi:hypothetical protein